MKTTIKKHDLIKRRLYAFKYKGKMHEEVIFNREVKGGLSFTETNSKGTVKTMWLVSPSEIKIYKREQGQWVELIKSY